MTSGEKYQKNISDTLACGSCTTFWRHLGCRIYYWTYARQLGIYLLNIWSVMRLPSTISSLIYQWNLNKAARSGPHNKKLVSPFNQVRFWTIKWLQDHTNEKDKISGQWVTAEFLLSIVEHAKSEVLPECTYIKSAFNKNLNVQTGIQQVPAKTQHTYQNNSLPQHIIHRVSWAPLTFLRKGNSNYLTVVLF